jgi:hypothetical protein
MALPHWRASTPPQPTEAAAREPERAIWQGYLLSRDEQKRLNRLLTSALLDDSICHRLVYERDRALMSEYGLALDTQHWLCSIEADSLTAFAAAISHTI